MLIMLFFLSFNQSALWNMKDSLIITTSGSEVIPFIKVWAILPSAILLTMIFAFLSNRYSQEKVFYLMTSGFILFFALFAFVIYPNRDLLHPLESADFLEGLLPAGFKGLISMYRYWTFTGFYVICELWNTIVISILFWGFVNQITHFSEAQRFYSVLSIAYNVAIIAAGFTSMIIARNGALNSYLPLGHDSWGQTMMLLMLVIITSGFLIMGTYRWMHQNVLCEASFEDVLAPLHQVKKEDKLSLLESLRHVCQSKYLICIAMVVVAYSLAINLVEVVWKDQLRHLYPATSDYSNYINNLQVVQGLFALILSLCLAEIVRRFGWKKTALVTPILMLFTCILFFGMLFFQENLSSVSLALAGMSPLAFIVFFGSAHNCLSKSCKYSLFDTTKEMALVPLSNESKLKGKTAIDGVGVRFGKSGGSIIHQGLLILFTSVSASAPYVGAILLVVLVLWTISICHLGKWKEIGMLEIPTYESRD